MHILRAAARLERVKSAIPRHATAICLEAGQRVARSGASEESNVDERGALRGRHG